MIHLLVTSKLVNVYAQLQIAKHTKLSVPPASVRTTHATHAPSLKVLWPPRPTSNKVLSQAVHALLLMVKTHAMPSTEDFLPWVPMALPAQLATLVEMT